MEWGGVDIRNGGNPIVAGNLIHNGQADGIVIGEGGKGIITENEIRGISKLFNNYVHPFLYFKTWI